MNERDKSTGRRVNTILQASTRRKHLLRTVGFLLASIVLVVPAAFSPAATESAPLAAGSLDVSPDSGPAGSTVTVSGSGWGGANSPYRILWESPGGTELGSFSPGEWSTNVTIPSGASTGNHSIVACAGHGTEFETCTSASFKVIVPDTPTPSATFTPSPTFTPSVTPSPTLAECIDEITILSPGINDDGSWVDLGGVEEVTMEVEVIFGRDEPPEVEFYGNPRSRPFTQWPDPDPERPVDVETDPSNPYRYLFTVEGIPLRRGYNEVHVEVSGTCASRDVVYRQFNNGMPFTPTPRPDECGGLGLGPDPQVFHFNDNRTPDLREMAREDFSTVFGTSFEAYFPRNVTPRSDNYVGSSTASREFGSIGRPIQMTFLRPLQAVGTYVGMDSAEYVESEVMATLTIYGYRGGGGELVRLGADSVSFPPEPSDVVHCLSFEAEEGDLISKATLDYRDAAGTSMAERRIMDDLTLVYAEEETVPNEPPQVEVTNPNHGQVLEHTDVVARAGIIEDRELAHVSYRLNDGDWQEIAFTPASDDPTRFLSAVSLASEELRLLDDNTITFRAEDTAGQTGEDSVTFRFDPGEPFHFASMRYHFSQHGPFDVFRFPEDLIAHKSSALRVTGVPQLGDYAGPVAIDEAELTVNWLLGGEDTYRGHRKAGSGFVPGGPFEGDVEIFFFLDGADLPPGIAYFDLKLIIGDEIVYRRLLGSGTFEEVPPQYLYVLPVADPLRGDYALQFYREMANMARAYPVRDGAAPFGSALARSGEAGLIYEVAPTYLEMPNGRSPGLGIPTYAWDLIQDEAEERARLDTDSGTPIDCNQDGTIDEEDDEVVWLTAAGDDEDRTFAVDKMEPRGSLQWNWTAPEDADGDGVISNADLAKFVVEFYDLDGDNQWHDFQGADRGRFSPGDPYHTYKDDNRNCDLDGGEKDTLAFGARRKDNAWGFMRSNAERRMEEVTDENGLPRIATVAILPGERVDTFSVVGNCGDSGICWAATDFGMAIGHEVGHGWGLDHDTPVRIPDGALNITERSWIEEGASRNFMFENVGDASRENFAAESRFFQLIEQAYNGWDYFHLAAMETGGPGLAAPDWQPPIPVGEQILALYGSITLEGELQVDEIDIRAGEPPAPPEPGPYSLIFLSEEGEELSSVPFSVETESICDGCPHDAETVSYEKPYVSVRAPFPEKTERIEIHHSGSVLASLERSVYAPSVELLTPQSREYAREQPISVRWRASDRDDQELRYSLAYSVDGGGTFTPIAVDLTETSYRWTPTNVPGSEQAVLRVTATDGFNQVEAESETFTLTGGGPIVTILSPSQGAELGDESAIVLEASAIDLEDGMLDGESVVWSEQDGEELGQGPRLVLNGYERGEHTFAVRAVDGEGNEATASVTVEVVESPPPEQVEVDGDIILSAGESTLAAGSCYPSTTRVTAEFPVGTAAENVRLMVNAAGQPYGLREMKSEGEDSFSVALEIGRDDPIGSWEFAVLSETAGGEAWSAPASLEVRECPQPTEVPESFSEERRVILPVVIGLAAFGAIVLLAGGGFMLWRRRNRRSG